jgi:hypothetical protein
MKKRETWTNPSDLTINKHIQEILTNEPKLSIIGRLAIISYELGDLIRDLFYANRFPEERWAHLANAKLSLADVFTQLSILCRELGFNEEEIRKLGWEHLRERFEEFKKRGWVPLG